MTGITLGVDVAAGQFEIREVMVESCRLPTAGLMAFITGSTESTVVSLILGMTIDALIGCVLQISQGPGVQVALRADQICMKPRQWKVHLSVIEFTAYRLDTVMAGETIFSERDRMGS